MAGVHDTLQERVAFSESIEVAFSTLDQLQIKVLFIVANGYLGRVNRHQQILALALRHGIATCVPNADRVRTGVLTSYSDDRVESYRLWGIMIGRILKGARPAQVPIVYPARLHSSINIHIAKSLGLTISEALLSLADEVIE